MTQIKDNDLSCLSLNPYERSTGRLLVAANDNDLRSANRRKYLPTVIKPATAMPFNPGRSSSEQEPALLPILSGMVLVALALALGLGVFVEPTAVDSAISDAAGTAFSTTAHATIPSGAWLLDSGW